MNSPSRTSSSPLDFWGWWLWGLTFVVLCSLTLAVVLLEGWLELPNGRLAGAALGGFVGAFCLLIAAKQAQINRLRRAMTREESDLSDMRTRLSEMTELFRLSGTLNFELPLDIVLEIIVRRVVSTLSAQQASVMIYDAESGSLETRASYGLGSEVARQGRRKLGEGIAGWVAQHRQALLLGPGETTASLREHYRPDRNITSALSLPIGVGDRCLGVLNVNRVGPSEPFREHHRDLLRIFAEHVGVVVEGAETMSRLGARARALEATNVQLSELNRLKDMFLSTASHELRTPLTSVIGYAEVLEENEGRLSSEQRREFLRRMSSEANSLLDLINDILDITRLQNGTLELRCRPSAINAVAHAALESMGPLADKHGIQLVEQLDATLGELSLDDVKIRQAIVNLLANAIKFSPAGGVVALATRAEGGGVVVEVRDQGPGILPEEADKIFELFGQAVRHGGAKIGGLGIGLHLVRCIAELHGGRAGVDSEAGKGSTFWLRLPPEGAGAATGTLDLAQAA